MKISTKCIYLAELFKFDCLAGKWGIFGYVEWQRLIFKSRSADMLSYYVKRSAINLTASCSFPSKMNVIHPLEAKHSFGWDSGIISPKIFEDFIQTYDIFS